MNDLFLQLQIENAPDEVNKALLPFDIIIRMDETGKPSSFTIENFDKKEISTNYINISHADEA